MLRSGNNRTASINARSPLHQNLIHASWYIEDGCTVVDAPKIAEDREASMFTFDLLEPPLVPPYPAPEFEEYKDPELTVSLKLMPIRVMSPVMFGYSNRCRRVEI